MYLVLGAAVLLNLVEIAAARDQGLPSWPFVLGAIACFVGVLALIRPERADDRHAVRGDKGRFLEDP
jgi:hypothetical protein